MSAKGALSRREGEHVELPAHRFNRLLQRGAVTRLKLKLHLRRHVQQRRRGLCIAQYRRESGWSAQGLGAGLRSPPDLSGSSFHTSPPSPTPAHLVWPARHRLPQPHVYVGVAADPHSRVQRRNARQLGRQVACGARVVGRKHHGTTGKCARTAPAELVRGETHLQLRQLASHLPATCCPPTLASDSPSLPGEATLASCPVHSRSPSPRFVNSAAEKAAGPRKRPACASTICWNRRGMPGST